MSRVLLVSANLMTEPFPVFPLGLAVLAGALERAGITVRQMDLLMASSGSGNPAALAEALRAFAPDLIAVSLRNIDNVDSLTAAGAWTLDLAREVVARCRATSAAPVALGGAGFSLMPEAILDYTGADYGVVGRGEEALCALVRAVAQGEDFPRLTSGNDFSPDHTCQDTRLAFEPEMARWYARESGLVSIQSKRGCPYRCAYCSYPLIEGSTVQARDPREVVDDIERLAAATGVRTLYFTDSVFNDPAGHWRELALELTRRDLGVRWCGLFRPEEICAEDLDLLRRSGLYAAEVGSDAASDATLAGLDKGFDFARVETFHRAMTGAGIPCAHFVIFAGPGETRETVGQGLANLARLEQAVIFGYAGIRILPGTTVQRIALDEGVIGPDDDLLRPVFYHSPHVEPEWLHATLEQGFRGQRGWIFPPEEGERRIRCLHGFGYRGILWDTLVPGRARQEVRA